MGRRCPGHSAQSPTARHRHCLSAQQTCSGAITPSLMTQGRHGLVSCSHATAPLCDMGPRLSSLVYFPHCAVRGRIPGSPREPIIDTGLSPAGKSASSNVIGGQRGVGAQAPHCSFQGQRTFEEPHIRATPSGAQGGKGQLMDQRGPGTTCGGLGKSTEGAQGWFHHRAVPGGS